MLRRGKREHFRGANFQVCTQKPNSCLRCVDEPTAMDALDTSAERWNKKYPKISRSCRDNWPNMSAYFKYPQKVHRLMYTTNAIEGFNCQLQTVTKTKSVFLTDDRLLKMLYMARIDITKKWTGRRQDWSMIHAQLAVFFANRMPGCRQELCANSFAGSG